MEFALYYTLGAIIVYGASVWILERIEEMRGKRFAHRNVIFFVIIFVLALILMELVNPPHEESSAPSPEVTAPPQDQ